MLDIDRQLEELTITATRDMSTPPADIIRRHARHVRHVRAVTGVLASLALVGSVAMAFTTLSDRDAATSVADRPTRTTANPTASSSLPPEARTVTHGGKYWAVYLAVAPSDNDPRLDATDRQARSAGLHPGSGDLACDRGAREGLASAGVHLEPKVTYVAVSLFFDTESNARAFVDQYAPAVVGAPVLIQAFCLD